MTTVRSSARAGSRDRAGAVLAFKRTGRRIGARSIEGRVGSNLMVVEDGDADGSASGTAVASNVSIGGNSDPKIETPAVNMVAATNPSEAPETENASTTEGLVEEDAVLDLTSSQLHTLKDTDLPATLVELDLTANRLTELDERIGHMTRLKKLSLRQNLLEDSAIEDLNKWPAIQGLEELVVRDNRLARIPVVSPLKKLVIFDVSFNKITSMEGVSKLSPTLREIYLSSNAIPRIEELDHLEELQILELGFNKVRKMDGLQKLTKLKELWLGRNRITSVNMCGLTSLTRVSVQSNHLTSMRGFEACVLLEELYLSHNKIAEMEGLSSLTKLRILDVSSNKLETVKDLENLKQLEDLWLNDNNIPTLEGIEAGLQGVKNSLTVIYLERNPCARNNPEYTSKLRKMLPKLVQIDCQFFD
ncbi:hypothetical protein R1sor_022854 [Riccia sorocarpa]|uniref:Protein phosphatase 1 regulatory subunit 7 n=1 Tax=Riccia sorocarpa TaxID=122646 RepID=A0ABD3GLT4_9MARC